jgi:hypothetical protein
MLVDARGIRYGCAYARGTWRKLPGQEVETNANNVLYRDHFEFERRWVAYASYWLPTDGRKREMRVYSFNLKNGKTRRSKGWQEGLMHDIVLKNNGSIAWTWIYKYNDRRFARVSKIDFTKPHWSERTVADDSRAKPADKIKTDTLELLPGGTSVGWQDVDGERNSAPLR